MDVVYTAAKTGYQTWMEEEGIPVVAGYGIEDVTELPPQALEATWRNWFVHPIGRQRWSNRHVCRRDPVRGRSQS